MNQECLKIEVGKNHTTSRLIKQLDNFGYDRIEVKNVSSGEYYVFGDRVIIYPVNSISSFSIDYFGDFVEKIIENSSKISTDKIDILQNTLILDDGTKISKNDYIVHEDCGIGIFKSKETRNIDNEQIHYINIIYLNENTLRLPVNLVSKLSPYIGVGRRKPKLSKLGSSVWKKNYHKIYENILVVARELLKIYAVREIQRKVPYSIEKKWDKEVRKTFGFNETEDQEKAIIDVYEDLVSTKPMDRLICGDVGFGKTEIAIRAMVQSSANGYQTAILVPTTLLANQHYLNIKKRCSNLPINVGLLSRLAGKENNSNIFEGIKRGEVDIAVGTHALLSEGIKFKKLGLLIIDEEQKFGVKQKEKIKKLRGNIDILAMTATPIPRTLFMSLSGIRDISQINEPPLGRKEIATEVSVFDNLLVKRYLEKELARGGQSYYLHNDVATILAAKKKIETILPQAKVAVGHGQMSEQLLSRTMQDFAEGKIDILVCSTIIENGLDLPNVNTIVVDSADMFGLSQLYQIRGRVGRSDREAYALFLHKKNITNNAFKRLRSLSENTSLGSGYNIALSDLEIRGGGNILGREQHGNMEAIGLVLYSKLLKQMVEKIRLEYKNTNFIQNIQND